MGCGQSSTPAQAGSPTRKKAEASPTSSTTKAPPSTTTTAGGVKSQDSKHASTPIPTAPYVIPDSVKTSLANSLIFLSAIHNGFKAAVNVLREHATEGRVEDFQQLWRSFQRAYVFHTKTEEINMFPYLDDISSYQITRKKLAEDHDAENQYTQAIESGLKKSQSISTEAFEKWLAFIMAHFDKEEQVILPINTKLGTVVEERQATLFKKIINPIFTDNQEELVWSLGWLCAILSKNGCGDMAAVDCIGTLALSLQRVTTPDRYKRYKGQY